jgi:hypothetical protein
MQREGVAERWQAWSEGGKQRDNPIYIIRAL